MGKRSTRGGEPQPVGDLLRGLLPSPGERLPGRIVWEKALGVDLAARCRPEALRDGLLVVAVDSAALFQELSAFRGQEILSRLAAAAPRFAAQRIRFRLAKGTSLG